MRFDEHPTWQMLESGKSYFKKLANAASDEDYHELADLSIVSFQSLLNLQLALENQLMLERSEDD